MKVKKYLGKSVNGFTILDCYPVTLESGKKTRKVLVKCDKCGREFERNSGVDFSHIKCKCMCAPVKPTKFHYIEFEGVKFTLTQFAKAHSINITTLSDRLAAGESPEQAIKDEIEKECICCGKKFLGKRINKYCSEQCYKRQGKRNQRRKKGIEPRNYREFKVVSCPYCSKEFQQNRARLTYCSKECARKANGELYHALAEPRRLEREKHRKLKIAKKGLIKDCGSVNKQISSMERRIELTKNCIICGKKFIAKSNNNSCCSKKCSDKNANRQKEKRLYKNGKPDLTINLNALYIRDNGFCQICGKHIDFNCDPNSDFYPSIDHIIPIAKGGLHKWDNVQLACRKCNYLKGDNLKI